MWLRTSTIGGRRVIAFDGKTLRGARDAAGNLTHLLAGLCQHTGTVIAQIAVGAKTNEIPLLTKLLDTLDITAAVITADALHCQRGTAEYIVDRGGHYIFTVKDNQRKLRTQLKEPSLETDPGPRQQHRTRPRPHRQTRMLKATEIAGGIAFPHAVQVLQLTRTVTDRKTSKRHTESRLRRHLARGHRRPPETDRRLATRPLAHREPVALGPRRHLRRGSLADQDQRRATGHGNAAHSLNSMVPLDDPFVAFTALLVARGCRVRWSSRSAGRSGQACPPHRRG